MTGRPDDPIARGAARFRARERERDIVERLKEFLPPNQGRHRTLASAPRLALALQDAACEIERLRDALNKVVCASCGSVVGPKIWCDCTDWEPEPRSGRGHLP